MIDCHAHVFPPNAASKLLTSLAAVFGQPPAGKGTVDDLAAHLRQAGISRAFCLTAALRPKQTIGANTWMISLKRIAPFLIPFGTVHPEHPGWETELDRLEQNGIHGLKIHPDLCGIALDDPRWHPVWEAAKNRFVIITHMGPAVPNQPTLSPPRALARVLDAFPGLHVVAAHLGGLFLWQEALQELAGRDLYFDTSSCVHAIPPALFTAITTRHDPARILFGSDYPLHAPGNALLALEQLLARSPLDLADLQENGRRLAHALGA